MCMEVNKDMEFVREDYLNKYSEIFKALSHPTRLCIVSGLIDSDEGRNVSTMQKCMSISQSSVSQHLRILKQADILDSERRGTEIIYFIKSEEVKEIIELIKKLN